MKSKILLMMAVCFAIVSFVGCGGGGSESAIQSANETNPQRLANLYLQCRLQNKGRGPKSEADLRKYITDLNPVLLKRMEVDPGAIDDLFVSERDGQALTVRYGVNGGARTDPQPIVFEVEGQDGKRRVAFTGGRMDEVEDEAAYQALLKSK